MSACALESARCFRPLEWFDLIHSGSTSKYTLSDLLQLPSNIAQKQIMLEAFHGGFFSNMDELDIHHSRPVAHLSVI